MSSNAAGFPADLGADVGRRVGVPEDPVPAHDAFPEA